MKTLCVIVNVTLRAGVGSENIRDTYNIQEIVRWTRRRQYGPETEKPKSKRLSDCYQQMAYPQKPKKKQKKRKYKKTKNKKKKEQQRKKKKTTKKNNKKKKEIINIKLINTGTTEIDSS